MYPPNQGGMRTTDRGSTTGAASWTDDELARRLPEGRAQRVNPPLTAIFKLRACTEVRAFLLIMYPPNQGGMRTT
ncbi:hypothetical protein SEEE6297_01377, partial [Salmonella enterica subsp. enterica serovar Enteritidis str. 561362 9-7]